MKTINSEYFGRMSAEWTKLNKEYDTAFQAWFGKAETTSLEGSDFKSSEEFQKTCNDLLALDAAYDRFFQSFLDTPRVQTSEELSKFKEMQGEVYPLENRLYQIAEKLFTPEEILSLKARQLRLLDIEQELFQIAEGKMEIHD